MPPLPLAQHLHSHADGTFDDAICDITKSVGPNGREHQQEGLLNPIDSAAGILPWRSAFLAISDGLRCR